MRTAEPIEVDAEALASVEAERKRLQRRLRSEQLLLAATRDQIAAATSSNGSRSRAAAPTVVPLGSSGRPHPVFVENPLAGVPIRLGAAALSVMLRLSATTQVLCAADEDDLTAWCASVGDRAGRVVATGWFAGKEMPC